MDLENRSVISADFIEKTLKFRVFKHSVETVINHFECIAHHEVFNIFQWRAAWTFALCWWNARNLRKKSWWWVDSFVVKDAKFRALKWSCTEKKAAWCSLSLSPLKTVAFLWLLIEVVITLENCELQYKARNKAFSHTRFADGQKFPLNNYNTVLLQYVFKRFSPSIFRVHLNTSLNSQ